MVNGSNPPRILFSAVPERILAWEQYEYHVKVSSTPNTVFKSGRGAIKVVCPYDGHRFFDRATVKKILDQIGSTQSEQTGRIGYLAVGPSLNWETDWSRPASPTIFPIDLPLQNGEIRKEHLEKDLWQVDVDHSYTPADVHYSPITIDISVLDDLESSIDISFDQFLMSRVSKDLLEGKVFFLYKVAVAVPEMIAHKNIQVKIDTLELEWPSLSAPWQMSWWPVDEKVPGPGEGLPWRYDTDRRSIILKDIPLKKKEKSFGSTLQEYECYLWMLMSLPGVFIRFPEKGQAAENTEVDDEADTSKKVELKGNIRVSIDDLLLSGREIAWLQADGAIKTGSPPEISQNTTILASFEALLSERFVNRPIVTYRRWVFPGVDLNEIRASDVAAALSDLAYQVTVKPIMPSKEAKSPAAFQVRGEKIQQVNEKQQASLEIEARLERSNVCTTHRERDLKGLHLSTDIETSDLILQLRGRMSMIGDLLDNDTARLLTILNHRFANVIDLR